MSPALLPTRGVFRHGDDVEVEVRGDVAGPLTVYHLGDVVAEHEVAAGAATVSLGPLPPARLRRRDGGSATLWCARRFRCRRPRAGACATGSSPTTARTATSARWSQHARRLHLTAVQCYDWAYRHADLLGGGERYDDPLGNAVSLATVRRLVEGLGAAGVATLGYAAVYGVGAAEWATTGAHLALLQADGTPYALGDFLSLVDPAAPEWLDHFVADLARAVASVGFDGFHLDQYGYPRRAVRHDGSRVDVAASFVSVIEAARAGLPEPPRLQQRQRLPDLAHRPARPGRRVHRGVAAARHARLARGDGRPRPHTGRRQASGRRRLPARLPTRRPRPAPTSPPLVHDGHAVLARRHPPAGRRGRPGARRALLRRQPRRRAARRRTCSCAGTTSSSNTTSS